jgi:hypothetical protein
VTPSLAVSGYAGDDRLDLIHQTPIRKRLTASGLSGKATFGETVAQVHLNELRASLENTQQLSDICNI